MEQEKRKKVSYKKSKPKRGRKSPNRLTLSERKVSKKI